MKRSDILTIVLLFVINLVVYFRWFFDYSYLTSGDWSFHFKESIQDFIGPPIWRDFKDFGSVDVMPAFYPAQVGYWILQYLGFDYNLMERIFYFWPAVLISSFGMFFFANRLFQNNFIALISSIVYSFNTIFISFLAGWLTFAVVYSILPLIFLLLFELLDRPSGKKTIIFGIILGISFSYEPRISYVVSILVLFYLLYDSILQIIISKNYLLIIKRISLIFIVFSIFILLHFFWILPTVLSTSSALEAKLAASPFTSYNTIYDAITLHNYAWNGESLKPFVRGRGDLDVFLFLIPISSFGYLAVSRRLNKIPIFFSIVAIVGIFLIKQGNSPFPDTYEWLFYNLPTFRMFRESSKFWILIAFSYAILIGYFLNELSKNIRIRDIYYLFSILFIIILLWNTKSVIDGSLGFTFVGKDVPQDYGLLKNYLNSDKEYYRTLWVPEKTRFSFYNNLHPSIGLYRSIGNEWKDYVDYKLSQFKWPIGKKITYILNQNYSKTLIDSSSIRYVIIPYDRDNETFIHYGKKDFYISELDNISWLRKVNLDTSNNTVIFENIGYKNHIYSPKYIFIDTYPRDKKIDKDEYYNKIYDFTQKSNISDYAFFSNDDRQNYLGKNFIHFENNANISVVDRTNFILQYQLFEGIRYKLYRTSSNHNEDNLFFNGQEINFLRNDSVSIVSKENNEIKISSKNFNITNIISNPSFEHGLWNKPNIGMNLSNDSTDGNISLQLYAQRRSPTSTLIRNLSSDNIYLFIFDYRTVNNNLMSYAMQFSAEKERNIYERIVTKNRDWNTYEKIIEPPEGISYSYLSIFAEGFGENKPYTINRYDNFKLYNIPKYSIGNYFFVSEIREFKIPNINIRTINPGRYDVEIYNATTAFPLILSESYDKNWKASINGNDSEQISEKNHFITNGFANGWYVDRIGNYTITLEYKPQRLFYLGLKVSISTIVILIILLIIPKKRR